MTQPKNTPALQNQRTPPKRLPRIMQQIQLRLARKARYRPTSTVCRCGRQKAHVFDCQRDLHDVVFDKQFCAGEGAVEEPRDGYISQIAEKPGAKDVDQSEEIIILSRDDDRL